MNISVKAEGDSLASSPPRPLLASSSSLDLKHARIDGNEMPRSEVWSVTSLVPTHINVEGEGNVASPSNPRSRSLSESPIALLLRYAPDNEDVRGESIGEGRDQCNGPAPLPCARCIMHDRMMARRRRCDGEMAETATSMHDECMIPRKSS